MKLKPIAQVKSQDARDMLLEIFSMLERKEIDEEQAAELLDRLRKKESIFDRVFLKLAS